MKLIKDIIAVIEKATLPENFKFEILFGGAVDGVTFLVKAYCGGEMPVDDIAIFPEITAIILKAAEENGYDIDDPPCLSIDADNIALNICVYESVVKENFE